MNDVNIKNRVTNRSAGFSTGSGVMSNPGSDQGAGGGAVALPYGTRTVRPAGGNRNASRVTGARERHHNGGTFNLTMGSKGPSR